MQKYDVAVRRITEQYVFVVVPARSVEDACRQALASIQATEAETISIAEVIKLRHDAQNFYEGEKQPIPSEFASG